MEIQSASVMSLTLIELGVIVFGLSVVARLADKLGVSAIPLYLMVGLAVGNNSLLPLDLCEDFVRLGAEIGVILLLFTMGLEYSSDRLRDNLGHTLPASLIDLVLNFPPGFVAGLLLGWSPLSSVLLGGITYISSSGIIAKLLTDLGWMDNGETATVLGILVLEDIAMALFLPLVAMFMIGHGVLSSVVSMLVALVAGGAMLFVAMRYGRVLSRLISHTSDEIVLLTTLGLALLVAGVSEQLRLSAAVGAFLVGITLSGPVAEKTHRLMHPLTDWFAAIFFLFFGLRIELQSLPPVMLAALGLVLITAVTKLATGWWSTRRLDLSAPNRLSAGVTLIARGEFSLVIAGMGMTAGVEPQLGALTAAYVLFSVLLGTVLTHAIQPWVERSSESELVTAHAKSRSAAH